MTDSRDSDSDAFWWRAARDGRSDSELFTAALEELDYEDEQWEASTQALWALLARSTPEIMKRALALVDSPDPEARRLGIRVAAGMNDAGTRTADSWGRRLYTDRSVPTLVRLAETDPDGDVRVRVAAALEEVGDPAGIAAFDGLVSDPDPAVRRRSAFALGAFADEPETQIPAVRMLLGLAVDRDREVRDAGVFSLGLSQVDTPEVREVFVSRLADEDATVASDAAAALAQLADDRGRHTALQLMAEGALDDGFFVIDALQVWRGADMDAAIDEAKRAGVWRAEYESLRTGSESD